METASESWVEDEWERVRLLRGSSIVSPSGETGERAWAFLRGGETVETASESRVEGEWERGRLFTRLLLGRGGENLTVVTLEPSESVEAARGGDEEVTGVGTVVGASGSRTEKGLVRGREEEERESEEEETVVGAETRGIEEGMEEGLGGGSEGGGSKVWDEVRWGRRIYTVGPKPNLRAS